MKSSCWPYGGRTVDIWWQRKARLSMRLPEPEDFFAECGKFRALAGLAERSMGDGKAPSDGEVWFSAGEKPVYYSGIYFRG